MNENNDKKNDGYYFPVFMALGVGVALNQIAIGICLGLAIGLALDYKKKK